MRGVVLTACSLVALGMLGWACDNDPTTLPGGPTGQGGAGGATSSNNTGAGTSDGGSTTSTGGMGGMGTGGNAGGNGGMGGTIEITECVADLNPQEAATDIVISEVSIGNYIEVYNPTADTKSLGGVAYQGWTWCAKPSYPQFQSTAAGISLPPGSYRTIPWPTLNVGDNANGELGLYVDSDWGTAASLVDYVCWGTEGSINGGDNRKGVAVTAGEWTGACAASTTNGVIRRLNDNNGDEAAEWDSTVTAEPTNCDQP